MNIPIEYQNITLAHDEVEKQLSLTYDLQERVSDNETAKAFLWQELLKIPDFKPGRSNLERDAKLGEAFPDEMAKYIEAEASLALAKHNLELAGLVVKRQAALMRLAEILAS